MTVIWTQHGHYDLGKDGGQLVKWWGEKDAIMVGSPEWEIIKELKEFKHEKDLFIKKTRSDAFMATELKNSLKERGIKTIIISGALTNLCCEDTVRAAFNHDFAVFFLGECTAASTKEMQKASLLNLKYGYAVIYTVNEIVKGIETAAIENKIVKAKL